MSGEDILHKGVGPILFRRSIERHGFEVGSAGFAAVKAQLRILLSGEDDER